MMAITTLIARVESANTTSKASAYAPSGSSPLLVSASLTDDTSHMLDDARSPSFFAAYLRSIYGQLKKHYHWFRRTQRGQVKQYSRAARSRTEAYRWRGRSELHVLTSGMDDYPRGPPHVGELHLDLICWMGFFTRTMADVARFIGEKEDEISFKEIEGTILRNIEGKNVIFCLLPI